ncbi:MAG: sugar ABC transporter ATP-binding protein [Eubacteriales bacterium]|nr:sugar ABC transporter ATP-binding protein [Eubacteriales bacterium]
MENQRDILFEAHGITKNFATTRALHKVDLTLRRGEVRGLIGENGSGKSTLSSIAAGMQPATEGEMLFKGKPYKPATMLEGAALGFGMIVQEMGTVSGLTVAENIFLGKEERFRGRLGLINRAAMMKEAQRALERIGFTEVSPDTLIDRLDMQDRKLVEVAKVMYGEPEVMVVDETTTALSQKGRRIVYRLMQQQKEDGKAVLFIGHDLEEVMTHCDSLTVLRDGELVATLEKKDFDEKTVKRHMVGREIGEHYYREDAQCTFEEEVLLRASQITCGHGDLMNFSCELHKGEILGVGGLSNCGMHELGRALFGEEPIVTGEIVYAPTGESISSARVAIKNGMGYVSKNRDTEALVLTASVRDNIIGASFDLVEKHGLITPRAERAFVNRQIDALSIKCSSMEQNVQQLSGGNKQKVVFGKWLGRGSEILVLDCPTRGVDIGVKAAMYQLMEDMKRDGHAILMISEEMTELIGMCDRILVIKKGRLSGELTRGIDMDENAMIDLMI